MAPWATQRSWRSPCRRGTSPSSQPSSGPSAPRARGRTRRTWARSTAPWSACLAAWTRRCCRACGPAPMAPRCSPAGAATTTPWTGRRCWSMTRRPSPRTSRSGPTSSTTTCWRPTARPTTSCESTRPRRAAPWTSGSSRCPRACSCHGRLRLPRPPGRRCRWGSSPWPAPCCSAAAAAGPRTTPRRRCSPPDAVPYGRRPAAVAPQQPRAVWRRGCARCEQLRMGWLDR
mmetsp:Transcript_68424/g.212000  ORF Transcript_68424/g.212000 Transcript_68424/m.212000 type:complete len:230 (+) Transcript_68424:352-1041(+)